MEGMDPAAASGMGEDVMKKLMEDMEGMSQREDFGEVMDNLMHQLVGKDIMQEPVKKICDKVRMPVTQSLLSSAGRVARERLPDAGRSTHTHPSLLRRPVPRVVGGEQERAVGGGLRAVRAPRTPMR